MPATFGEQGALLARGLPAVLLSIGGDRPPPADAPISRQRLETFGRAALRTVTVLDAAPAARPVSAEASSRDLLTSRKILPAWAVRLFIGMLLLTVLVTAVDAFAALLRRREPIVVWLRWTLASALPFLLAALFAIAARRGRPARRRPGAPVAPQALPADAAGAARRRCSSSRSAGSWLRPPRCALLRADAADRARRARGSRSCSSRPPSQA